MMKYIIPLMILCLVYACSSDDNGSATDYPRLYEYDRFAKIDYKEYTLQSNTLVEYSPTIYEVAIDTILMSFNEDENPFATIGYEFLSESEIRIFSDDGMELVDTIMPYQILADGSIHMELDGYNGPEYYIIYDTDEDEVFYRAQAVGAIRGPNPNPDIQYILTVGDGIHTDWSDWHAAIIDSSGYAEGDTIMLAEYHYVWDRTN